jgi:hypothetical protein
VAARTVLVLLVIAAACGMAAAQPERAQNPAPTLHTAEQEIAEALRPGALAIADPLAVFSFVLRNLPERVQVYPTENYYYFRFVHNGVPYTGNIRLAAADRDLGKVHFAYNEQPSDWRPEPPVRHRALDGSQGVTVTKLAPLTYRVEHDGKAVTLVLNDLTSVKPPAGLLRPDEVFLGPVFDESGVRFFLVFNSRLRIFHYLLDEAELRADELSAAGGGGAIEIGKRTGFAFYRDGARRVLIGVNERNSRLNTLFDGPFDQLPENFIEGGALRDAIIRVSPGVKDRIDRFGNFSDGSSRYLIHPYRLYRTANDLMVFHRCMTSKAVAVANRPRCFVIGDDESLKRNPLPLALKRR